MSLSRLAFLGVLAVCFLFVCFLIVFALVQRGYSGRNFAGVTISRTNVGHLTPDQTLAALRSEFSQVLDHPVVIVYANRTWNPTSDEVGLHYDMEGSARAAYAIGRQGNLFARAWDQVKTAVLGKQLQVAVNLDDVQLAHYLDQIGSDVNAVEQDATFAVQGGQVTITPSTTGYHMDVQGAIAKLRALLPSSQPVTMNLPVTEIRPAVDTAVVETARQAAEAMLAAPLVLAYGDHAWSLSPQQLADMLEVRQDVDAGGRVSFRLSLNQEQLGRFVDGIALQLEQKPKDAVLSWNGSKVEVVEKSQDGVGLDKDATIRLIGEAAGSTERRRLLPVVVQKPRVPSDDLNALGIVELIGQGVSDYSGSSPERAHNAELAASKFRDIVIAPGETFSFDTALGPVTAEAGYQEGLSIIEGRTVQDIGGGVCQVSTTVFRAAFWAGMDIVERTAHAYRVRFYEQGNAPVGMDATVYPPSPDLRFKNDTGHFVLMEPVIDKQKKVLTVNLFGTSPGWTVKMEGPVVTNQVPALPAKMVEDPALPAGEKKQVDWAHDGLDVLIRRIVEKDGKTLKDDKFFARYQPWSDIFLVGTGQPAREPTPEAGATSTTDIQSDSAPSPTATLEEMIPTAPATDSGGDVIGAN